jgi:hypothetical protein
MSTGLDGIFGFQLDSARAAIRSIGLEPESFEFSCSGVSNDPGAYRVKVRKQGAVSRIYTTDDSRDWLFAFVEDLRLGRFD